MSALISTPLSTRKKLAALAGIAMLACLGPARAGAAELRVVSTFSILSDLAKNVGGDRIALTTLVGPDGDAHTYEPRPADLKALGAADVILANGLQLEGFLPGLMQASGARAPVAALTDGITPRLNGEEDHDHDHEDQDEDQDHGDVHGGGQGHEQAQEHEQAHEQAHEHEHEHGHHHHGKYDPHAWQTVPNARIYVSNIARAFCAADRQGCPAYEANARAYDGKLAALQAELEAAIAGIPADRRTIITPHDAFAYFGQAYGFKFEAPQGMSTDSEASASGVAALVRQVREEKAAALFLENISNPRLVEQISKETGVKVGGKLYSDALSGPDGPAATYIDMMRHNVRTIRDAVLATR